MNYTLIKESRKALGYTQKEVAASIGMTQGTYRNFENGYKSNENLSAKRLYLLSIKLNLRMENIMKTLTWEELEANIKAEGLFTESEIKTMELCEEDYVNIFCESEVVTVAKDVRRDGESIGYIRI